MSHRSGPIERRDIHALLGNQTVRFVECTRRSTSSVGDARVDDLAFRTDRGSSVPAYFAVPDSAPGPGPALLYCHAHGNRYDIGREELLAGRKSLQAPYLDDLAALGLRVLCLEMACFGERSTSAESAAAKAGLWRGAPLFGTMLAELSAGIDFLAAHPDIDAQRIGVLGFSRGGTHAWWSSALDERVRAAASLCCFADLDCLIETGAHDGHGHYMVVPGLLRTVSTGALAGLCAPRALLVCVGLEDWSTPRECFEKARGELETQYARRGAAANLAFHVEPQTGHEETPAMRRQVLAFLGRHL